MRRPDLFGISKLPLDGFPGIVFALGFLTLLIIALPPIRAFFILSVGLGLVIGFFFWLARKMDIWH
jgi:hypothetical protein